MALLISGGWSVPLFGADRRYSRLIGLSTLGLASKVPRLVFPFVELELAYLTFFAVFKFPLFFNF